jgi:hypothetical protein
MPSPMHESWTAMHNQADLTQGAGGDLLAAAAAAPAVGPLPLLPLPLPLPFPSRLCHGPHISHPAFKTGRTSS